jgi:hypothetical protein
MRPSTALIAIGLLLVVIPVTITIPFIGLFVGTALLIAGVVLRLLGA